ncbi:MAG: TIR domain-containing protein [Clostridia bacterium]|nr:TIR domain-containing protein [Clostridia bacterium]
MTYKCKICGGQTTLDTQNGIAICEYCGTRQALPLFTEESERLLYESGNNYLSHSEYDKAENVFNQLLTIKPNTAELYWDLVLCKYGVTYVKDPKSGKYIPTCNRTHYTPIFSDNNYKKAIELSSGEKKALFEDDAKTIDNIQKGIIAVSKKEKPFDIFISYKETDANGNRTKDSIEAQKLYERLTEAGYKVFFSRITLEDKIGTEYEPYIYAALYSSKVMLTVSSSRENIDAVWVKNEWSRFLGFRQNDNSKSLLPLYFDMEKADLPDEFALLPCYNMTADGFEDELLRGIKKLIPLPIMKAKRRKKIAKISAITAACVCAVAITATAIFLPGYLEEKRNQKAYQNAQTLFGNAQYEEAAKEFEALGEYRDSTYMLKRCAIQPDYDAAMKLYYDGNYPEAVWAFEDLGDYEDAAEQAEKAKVSWRKSLANVVAGAESTNSYATYYITANGGVADTDSKSEIAIADGHGKAISIETGNSGLLILYEDGTISEGGKIITDEKWQDIVQIAPSHAFLGKIALKADGTVLVEDPEGGEHSDYKAAFASYENAADWKNVVMISGYAFQELAGISTSLAAVDVDGNVYLAAQIGWFGDKYNSFMDHKDMFKNVESICVVADEFTNSVDATALTKDGKIITYSEGRIWSGDAKDVIEIGINATISSDGKMRVIGSNAVNATDVVKFCNGHYISRSGSISMLEGCKTAVHDEWLSRLG